MYYVSMYVLKVNQFISQAITKKPWLAVEYSSLKIMLGDVHIVLELGRSCWAFNVKNTRKGIAALHDSKELTNSCEHVSKFTAKDKHVNFGGRHYGWLPQPRKLASTDKALPTVYSSTLVCKIKLLQLYLFIRSDY